MKKKFVPKDSAFHIGNGIDTHRFDPDRTDLPSREETRAKLGIPAGAIVIGTVGRLVYEKGFREFFQVVRHFRAQNQNIHFLIIGGEEPDQNDAVSKIEMDALVKEGGVQFLGARADVDSLYRIMDVFVLLSHREGIPRALMEAQAMKVPAVVTDIRGCREVIEHTETGYLVALHNVSEACHRIQELVSNSQLRLKFGDAARKKVLEEFREEQVHHRIEKALRQILSERETKKWN